jgi:UDP:flavonoid glycosyltransferase YjiC (YdhE family)
MRVLLVPFGSHGDVHPFVALGHSLRARGHSVTFVISDYFGPLVRGLGFDAVSLGDAGSFADVMRDPEIWHPRRGFAVVAREVLKYTRLIYTSVRALYVPHETVAVGATLAFAVRLASEAIGLPAATVHLQPAIFHSNHATPVYPGMEAVVRWPRWFKRVFFDVVYARFVDPKIAPGLNSFRAELGLPPARDVMRRGIHSPECTLGFFPAWFGPPQPDWPPRVELVGFPLYDERDATPLPSALDAFLDAGPPPVVFTPGSANVHARPFFEAAAAACSRLGVRGLFLTRFAEQVPTDLPEAIRHFAYAPFSGLLPRVAALVHHGGVGTAAQGMAAAVPQVVMPLSHDQFDNAARLRRLGVGRTLVPARFRGPELAETLRGLLDNPETAASCRSVAARFAADPHPMERASAAIEALLAHPQALVPA